MGMDLPDAQTIRMREPIVDAVFIQPGHNKGVHENVSDERMVYSLWISRYADKTDPKPAGSSVKHRSDRIAIEIRFQQERIMTLFRMNR